MNKEAAPARATDRAALNALGGGGGGMGGSEKMHASFFNLVVSARGAVAAFNASEFGTNAKTLSRPS